MKHLRLTEEQLAAIQKRNNKTTTTHLLKGSNPRRKYGNVKTEVDGITFDSKREADRWQELKLMQSAGQIEELERQVRFPLRVNREEVCCYIADFTYRRKTNGRGLVVEDVKGRRTRDYMIKRKLMRAIHGIEVLET